MKWIGICLWCNKEKNIVCLGMCRFCYNKHRSTKKPLCSSPNCGTHSRYSWLCRKHIKRLIKWEPEFNPSKDAAPATIEWDIAKIPLWVNAKDWYAIVDKEFARLDRCKWFLDSRWYVVSSTNKLDQHIKRSIHQNILNVKIGWYEIDHINRNKLDNRKCNLRIVTRSENQLNRWLLKSNTSWIRGVSYHKDRNTYVAQIKILWVSHRKSFKTLIEAKEYRQSLEIENNIPIINYKLS